MDLFRYYINEWFRNRLKMDSILYCQIHLTTKCQNHCEHCYFRELNNSMEDIPFEKLKELLNKIKHRAEMLNLIPRVDFTGGDPLLYPFIESATNLCKEFGIPYGFKCNPETLISPSSITTNLLKGSSGVGLSLDGLRETHDSIRRKGSFDCTLKAIKTIKELGLRLRINTTVSRENLNNLIPLLDFLTNEKIIIDDYTWARYWSLENSASIIDAKLLETVFLEMTNYMRFKFSNPDFYYDSLDGRKIPRIMFSFKEHQWYPFFVKNDLVDLDIQESVNAKYCCINCTATKHYYIIDPDLSVYKCRKLPETKIDISEIGTDVALNFHNKVQNKCQNCQYYNGCGGCSAITKCFTGNTIEIEPFCPYNTSE